jgi:2,3-bisphosphoglycerate-independent phosphoglycerate mutase
MENKAALVILDGWGIGKKDKGNAIHLAETPFMDKLLLEWPHSKLVTHGEVVGLPEGQMGNSEVGHLNIGAGRTVYQDLLKINRAIDTGEIFKNDEIIKIENYCLQNNRPLHMMGLVSDGGVHAHIEHLIALALHFDQKNISVVIHAFTDGRDTDPHKGIEFIKKLNQAFIGSQVHIASICGRYYAMDRDKRWDRIKIAYDMLVNGKGILVNDLVKEIEDRYELGESDEFLKPMLNANVEEALRHINNDDAVLFFNFRTDRPRQLTEVLHQKDHSDQGMKKLDLYYATMTEYDETFQKIHVVYPKKHLENTLGEVLSAKGKSQLRVAETEKYPHVTFFFNGGREQAFSGEERIMVDSPKVDTYDLKPEMSAFEITSRTQEYIHNVEPDFLCLNFANADMVGHTGDLQAAIKACETVDKCLKDLTTELLNKNYSILIIADHGNADYMLNEDGSPNTAHTKNPVHAILLSEKFKDYPLLDGDLTDVAPTILQLMGFNKGDSMTGKSLIKQPSGD